MSSSKFSKVDSLAGGEDIKIHFSGKGAANVNGVSLQNPFKTTVEYVKERTLDDKNGDDVDGIVVKKEVYLEVPSHDNVHGEYVITTERPAVGNNSVSPIEAREYFKGRPGNGKYTIHLLGFDDLSV